MRPRNPESGFAMLLVFLMAAVVAITLYMEIPRIAFESQRQKEQLLVERGEQYKRAIQVFVLNNKRWPGKIEDLENLNNRRYLRRRYKDPMTGKDEWRIIHIQNGVLTDSVQTKQKQSGQGQGALADNYISELSGIQGSNAAGGAVPNAATRRRPSDSVVLPPMGSDGGAAQTGGDGNPGQQPGGNPVPGGPAAPGMAGVPGMPARPAGPVFGAPGGPGGAVGGAPGGAAGNSGGSYVGSGCYIGNCTTAPGAQGTPGTPNAQGGQQPAYPGMPGAPVNSQTGGVSPSPYPTTPGMPGTPLNPQGMNPAAQMIQGLLTSPRPGGAPGGISTTTGQQNTMGGGWAGVASTADAEGIMVYGDRTNYGEWEFIFDLTKYKPPPNPIGGGIGTPAGQLGNPAGSNPTQQPAPGAPTPPSAPTR